MIPKAVLALQRRRKRQGGQEILEFGLVALCLYTPLLLGTFVVGMNLIKTIQAKNTTRDLADMYIHGADFSDGGYQTLTKELATGLNLQSPTYGSGTQTRDDTGTSGDGIIWISKIMYVGTGGGSNAGNFVWVQRVRIGNKSLIIGNVASVLGDPSSIPTADFLLDGEVNSSVIDYRNNANDKLGASAQASMIAMWITPLSPASRTALVDGQVIYVVEGYFQTPQFSLGGAYTSNGVYARYFF
ncbi:MAG TPA: hypothetical protein VLM42_15530 [Bryobacteraceae bacterium]|nr:hypothetical protein [Bryobacteraceae bacterium]